MRIISTDVSFESNEASFLATVETVIAAIGAISLTIWWGDYWLIVYWSLMGWLLLLRTKESMKRQATMFEYYYRFGYDRLTRWHADLNRLSQRAGRVSWPFKAMCEIILRVLFVLNILIASVVVKSYYTIVVFRTRPRYTLWAVPTNWMQAMFSLDEGVTPEIIPGFRKYVLANQEIMNQRSRLSLMGPPVRLLRFDYREIWAELRTPLALFAMALTLFISAMLIWVWQPFVREMAFFTHHPLRGTLAMLGLSIIVLVMIGCILASPLRFIAYFPTLAYRYALKATSVTYFPLLLIIQQSTSPLSVQLQYDFVVKRHWPALKRRLAWIFGLIMVMKIILISIEHRLVENFNDAVGQWGNAWGGVELEATLQLYLAPATMPGWHWATLINSLITIGFFYVADYLHWRMEKSLWVSQAFMLGLLRIVIVVTGLLGLYSMSANIWIILHHRPFIVIPGLGRLFPAL